MVSAECAKEDQYQMAASRAAKAGELRSTFVTCRLLSNAHFQRMEIVLIGDNHEKIDYVDRARKKGDGPVIGDFKSMREIQHAIAMVAKSSKPKRMKWLMDTGRGHDLMGTAHRTKDTVACNALCTFHSLSTVFQRRSRYSAAKWTS